MLGIDRNTYANWEKETHDVKSKCIPETAKIFDVEIRELFESNTKNYEINISKQVHNDSSSNYSVVLVLPNKEMVEKLVEVLKDKL